MTMAEILLTGATGFLGRHTLPLLEQEYGRRSVKAVSSRDYDLCDIGQVQALFRDHKPEVVVHFAGYSGGILANRTFPADFYFRNTVLTALVFEAAAHNGVTKIVYPFGGCSYPAAADSPIDEGQLWTGYPQAESAAYSTAKMMGTVAAKAYRAQHGMQTSLMVPGNMYGEFDNFHPDHSHVIPAFIRRFHEAKAACQGRVEMWGSGRPERDFVYAGDVARTVPYFIETYDSDEPVNISTGSTMTIRRLAETVASVIGYSGEVIWDLSRPDGQMSKIFDTTRMNALGLRCSTGIEAGLKRTIAWFEKNCERGSDGIRL